MEEFLWEQIAHRTAFAHCMTFLAKKYIYMLANLQAHIKETIRLLLSFIRTPSRIETTLQIVISDLRRDHQIR